MSESIVVALITGGLSLAGVVFTCLITAKKTEKAAAIAQAVTDTKLEELTREVREHNNFAQKMPVLQQEVNELKRRVGNLENYHKQPIN
jgi:polyhydroxyalkanoate synthesis regulator phasin